MQAKPKKKEKRSDSKAKAKPRPMQAPKKKAAASLPTKKPSATEPKVDDKSKKKRDFMEGLKEWGTLEDTDEKRKRR